jgi:hypothetical protein
MRLMASKFCDVKFTTAMYASLPLYLVFFGTIAFWIFLPDAVLWPEFAVSGHIWAGVALIYH